MRQNTLLNCRQMFKAEASKSLNTNVSTIDDNRINYMLFDKQNWLASEYGWPFLRTIIDVGVAGGAQYTALPALNYERMNDLSVSVFYNNFYQPLQYGIDIDEYNIVNVQLGQYQTPSERWCFSDENDFELWPVSPQGQVIRFIGQRPITPLWTTQNPYVWDDTAKLDLDDLLVVYFALSQEFPQAKNSAGQTMLSLAQGRLNQVRSSYPVKEKECKVRGDAMEGRREVKAVPIITIAPVNNR